MTPDNSSGEISPSRPASSSSDTPPKVDPVIGDTAHLRAANELAAISGPVRSQLERSGHRSAGDASTTACATIRPTVHRSFHRASREVQRGDSASPEHARGKHRPAPCRHADRAVRYARARARDDAERRQAESLQKEIGVLRAAVDEVDRLAAERLHFLEVRFVQRSQGIDTRFDESAKILDQVQSRT